MFAHCGIEQKVRFDRNEMQLGFRYGRCTNLDD